MALDNLIINSVLQIARVLINTIQPVIVPLCFIVAWVFVAAFLATIVSSMKQTVNRAKEMHKIPCHNCQFFTNDYRLKCTVNPTIANTEDAINCFDYRSKNF